MGDEKNLDLSLGLGSSSSKNKHGSSSDNRLGDNDRDNKVINDFKNFLEGGIQQHPVKADNYYNFPKTAAEGDVSKISVSGGIWMTNDSRSTEMEEENRLAQREKRKSLFGETSQQKKHERESNQPESEKTHISITTDEGSTAENEDVADSEVDGSTSRQVYQHEDVAKKLASSSSFSRIQKDNHAFSDRSGAEHLGQKRFNMSIEKDMNMMNMPYGVSYASHGVNLANMPYSQPMKDNNNVVLSSYPMPGMMHAMTTANSERPGMQSAMPATYPLMFGYSPVQLPVLDMDNSRPVVSHPQQIRPTYVGRNPISSDIYNDVRNTTQASSPVISHKVSESAQYDGRASDHGKNNGKRVGEDTTSGYAHGELKGDHIIHQVKDASESFPSEFPAIRPGIGAELKFGGSGASPNLPWVSTTAPGPNGKTISGVTYRYSPTQIRIVCACHGTHLSPEEFVRHASEDNTAQGLAVFPSSNPAASAQS